MAITNALQLEAARAMTALSRFSYNPCQVRRRWTCPLAYYSILGTDTLLYAVILTLLLWSWPLTSNICSISSVTWWF